VDYHVDGPPRRFTLNRFGSDSPRLNRSISSSKARRPANPATRAAEESAAGNLLRADERHQRGSQNGVAIPKTDQISARTVVPPTNVFAGYEALAARLANADIGSEFPTYVAGTAEVKVSVKAISDEAVTTPAVVQMRNASSSCTPRVRR
jgi:hypothetical protein